MLEAMTGAWRRDDHPIRMRMPVDDKTEIRRHRVEAGCRADASRTDAVNVGRDVAAKQGVDFLRTDLACDGLRRCPAFESFRRDFDAAPWTVDRRKAVDALRFALKLPNESGESIYIELSRIAFDIEPVEHLPINLE